MSLKKEPCVQQIGLLYTPLLLLMMTSLCVPQHYPSFEIGCTYPGQCDILNSIGACGVCAEGYVKDPMDDTRCKSGNVTGSLLITAYDEIIQISLDGLNTTMQRQSKPNFYGMDFDFKAKKLYWFEAGDNNIYSGPIHEQEEEKGVEHVTLTQVQDHGIIAISYDWIYENVYCTNPNEIRVTNKIGTQRKILFNDGLSWPISIVVNPLNGWLHWVDSDLHRIERAAMDGSNREVILSTDLIYPGGLTIDFDQNRIYWTHNEPGSISSSNFDGSDRKLIFTGNGHEFEGSLFTSIATFENAIYWVDFSKYRIYSVNKCDGANFAVENHDIFSWEIKVNDVSKQPPGENHCSNRMQKCSHFCFPVPVSVPATVLVPVSSALNYDPTVSTSCACPTGLYLSADGINCF